MKRVAVLVLAAGLAMFVSACASDKHSPNTTATPGVSANYSYQDSSVHVDDTLSTNWPVRFNDQGTDFTVFEPQADSWDGHEFIGRCAVAVQGPHAPMATYGVFGFTALTLVDKSAGTVKFANFRLTSADFPSERDQAQNYVTILARAFPQHAPAVPLTDVQSSLSVTAPPKRDHLNNVPPKIIVATNSAVLVYIDGSPALRPVAGTSLQRVINTRLLILKDSRGQFYLHLLDGYLQAPSLNGPWTVAAQSPAGATDAERLASESGDTDLMPPTPDPQTQQLPSLENAPPPQIIVATTPTELIQFRGAAQYAAIPDTSLLYAVNTSGNVFKSVKDQENYVLLSGRWYKSASLDGPWRFVPGADLPHDFANIPDDSPKENVKASVPGTSQAEEALIANSIPESTAVARTNQLAAPQIDGPLQLAPIEGTSLSYVVNSPTPIIKVADQSWYSCENGVWYAATSANGPWTVATAVPQVIYTIPPDSPLHYVTYVQVYGSDPNSVYEGYTPGYMGTEVADDGTVVYGTGYYYEPWIGSVWYGPPVTYGWGFYDCWTPWWGWGYGCGFGWGPGWGWGGYFPPRPWWCGFRHWHDHDGDRWWHGHEHGPWANANANVYAHHDHFAGPGRGSRLNEAGRFGQAYNSRTGYLQGGQHAAVRQVGSSGGAFHNRPAWRGYAGGPGSHISPRLGEMNRGYQTYPRGAWYGGHWPETHGNAFHQTAPPARGQELRGFESPRNSSGATPRGGGFEGGGVRGGGFQGGGGGHGGGRR